MIAFSTFDPPKASPETNEWHPVFISANRKLRARTEALSGHFARIALAALVVWTQAGFAQSQPPFVIEGPTVVLDLCRSTPTAPAKPCLSVTYPQGSSIAEQRVATAPRGNLEFDVPVLSSLPNTKACTDVSLSVNVNVIGPNGNTTSGSGSATFDTPGGGSVLFHIPIQVDWIESAVSFSIAANASYYVSNPRGKPGVGPGGICVTATPSSGGPDLSSIALPSSAPSPFPANAFLVLIVPSAGFQVPLLPIAILYGPLGNQTSGPGTKALSTMQFTNITGTNQQFINAHGQSNGVVNDDKTQYSAGISLGFGPPQGANQSDCGNAKCSISVGFQTSGAWDTSTATETMGVDTTFGSLATTSEQQITHTQVPAANEPPVGNVLFPTEPFWQDIIIAAANPQWAIFDYPAGGGATALGSANMIELPIRQLDACQNEQKEDRPVNEPTTVSAGPWAAGHAYSAESVILDANGNIEVASNAGTSGSTMPAWNKTLGGSTQDGTVIWTNDNYQFVVFRDSSVQNAQFLWRRQWAENHAYAAGALVYGYASFEVVTTAGKSGASIPSWNQQSGGTTSDGSVTWTNEPLQVWTPNHSYAAGSIVLDPDNDYQIATTGGTTGASTPNWTTGTTTDGSVTWTMEIPQTWQANGGYSAGAVVYGSAPYIQVATTGGTSGSGGPNWNVIAGSQTPDGTVTWTNETSNFTAYGGPSRTVWQWLSPDDCKLTSSVDQFYVQQSQAATPLAYVKVAPGQGINAPAGTMYTNKNDSTAVSGSSQKTQYSTKITSIASNSLSISEGINLSIPLITNILNLNIGADGSLGQSSSQTITNSTFDSQTLQNQTSASQGYQVSTSMQDTSTPATNIPVNIMQDSIYLGMAVQDTDMQFAPPVSAASRTAMPAADAAATLPAEAQGLPVVPLGESAAMLRGKNRTEPANYVVQLPYAYVRVQHSSNADAINTRMEALRGDMTKRHIARIVPPRPPTRVDVLSPMDTLKLLNRIPSPPPVQNAIKRLSQATP